MNRLGLRSLPFLVKVTRASFGRSRGEVNRPLPGKFGFKITQQSRWQANMQAYRESTHRVERQNAEGGQYEAKNSQQLEVLS
jgi:hypothetical protein